MKIYSKFTILVLISIIIHETSASQTLTPKNRGSKKKQDEKKVIKDTKVKMGPQKYAVFDKNLVSEDVEAKDVLNNYQAFFQETDEYNFNGFVLGYVTPWNNHGYDIAKIFGNKFTHISPVWLQVRRQGTESYAVTGTHDIDKQWVAAVRNAGRERKTKIVPRMLFDGWSGNDYASLLKSKGEIRAMIKSLVQSCKQYGFDGYVFELWSQVAGAVKSKALITLIKVMSDMFSQDNLELILVIPPKRGKDELFTGEHFDALYEHVTAFSLMTYDYSNPAMPGPNAPYLWIEETVTSLTQNETRRPKILMGLNFYGNDYTSSGGGSAIVGHEYIKVLEEFPEKKFIYNSEVKEHYFEYRDSMGGRHLVFYPSLYSISKRINLANKLKTGVSIWEIGQGLDYFYDLL